MSFGKVLGDRDPFLLHHLDRQRRHRDRRVQGRNSPGSSRRRHRRAQTLPPSGCGTHCRYRETSPSCGPLWPVYRTLAGDVYSGTTMNPPRRVSAALAVVVLSLYLVGLVSHTLLRHIVQTLPLWPPILWCYRGRAIGKWAALPCFAIWLFVMTMIWLFLLGIARVTSGHFTAAEVVLTLVIGASSLAGLSGALRWRPRFPPLGGRGCPPTLHRTGGRRALVELSSAHTLIRRRFHAPPSDPPQTTRTPPARTLRWRLIRALLR